MEGARGFLDRFTISRNKFRTRVLLALATTTFLGAAYTAATSFQGLADNTPPSRYQATLNPQEKVSPDDRILFTAQESDLPAEGHHAGQRRLGNLDVEVIIEY